MNKSDRPTAPPELCVCGHERKEHDRVENDALDCLVGVAFSDEREVCSCGSYRPASSEAKALEDAMECLESLGIRLAAEAKSTATKSLRAKQCEIRSKAIFTVLDAAKKLVERNNQTPPAEGLRVTLWGALANFEMSGNHWRDRDTIKFAAEQVSAATSKYKTALADAIRRPMGVVPDSAQGLVTQDEVQAAEERRPVAKMKEKGE